MQTAAEDGAREALATYNPAHNVPLERWIARKVEHHVIYEIRRRKRRRETQMPEEFWSTVVQPQTRGEPLLGLDEYHWRLLYEHYLEKLPLRLVAKRHNVTKYRIKIDIRNALRELIELGYDPRTHLVL